MRGDGYLPKSTWDDPDNVLLLLKAPEAIYWCGDWDYGDDNMKLSFSLAERAVMLQPNNADTHYKLGVILDLYGFGDVKMSRRAAEEYKVALDLNPCHPWAANGVALSRKYLNINDDKAIEIMERAIEATSERTVKASLL